MDEEENSTYKVYIGIYEEYENGSTTRYLKHLFLDDFLSDEEAMKCVISIAKEAGVNYWKRDDKKLQLGETLISPYWRELVEKIYEE